MPPEWAERILSDDETPLWTAGWIPLEPKITSHPTAVPGTWGLATPAAAGTTSASRVGFHIGCNPIKL